MRKHYRYSVDEWDELPWWQSRMYLEQLPEITPDLRHLSYRDDTEEELPAAAAPTPAAAPYEVVEEPYGSEETPRRRGPAPPAWTAEERAQGPQEPQFGLSPGTGGAAPDIPAERPAWLSLPIKRVEIPADPDAA